MPLRPTRHRLIIAMGVSACLVLLLLTSLGLVVKLADSTAARGSDRENVLAVSIRRNDEDPKPEPVSDNQAAVLKSQDDDPVPAVAVPSIDLPPDDLPLDEPPARDWRKIMTASVTATSDENRRREALRSSMWRQSYSAMFEPADEFIPGEPDPIISDFRFKPQIHVAGIGFTIGSCFIGIPVVGVPVEQRSVAITILVCAQDSG